MQPQAPSSPAPIAAGDRPSNKSQGTPQARLRTGSHAPASRQQCHDVLDTAQPHAPATAARAAVSSARAPQSPAQPPSQPLRGGPAPQYDRQSSRRLRRTGPPTANTPAQRAAAA